MRYSTFWSENYDEVIFPCQKLVRAGNIRWFYSVQGGGDGEVSVSLLRDTHSHYERSLAKKSVKSSSRVQSDIESEYDTNYKRKFGSVGHGSELSVERPNSARSEPAFSRKNRRKFRNQRCSEPPTEGGSKANGIRMQKVSIQSLEKERRGTSVTSVPATEAPRPESTNSVFEGPSGSQLPPPAAVENDSVADLHPLGWQNRTIFKILLSRYLIPAILLLVGQLFCAIVILLAADIITYNTMIQLTSVDSMISHIGMYASAVNSYLTTHAFALSQMAQDTMAGEFNLHLHHIAKVKAIFESDVVSEFN